MHLFRKDLNDVSRPCRNDRTPDPRKSRQNVFHPIPNIDDDDGTDSDLRKVLLKPEVLIRRKDHAEATIDGGAQTERRSVNL